MSAGLGELHVADVDADLGELHVADVDADLGECSSMFMITPKMPTDAEDAQDAQFFLFGTWACLGIFWGALSRCL